MKTLKSKSVQSIIAILIMFVAGYFIPTWGPVTRMGVQYLCVMIGWIYLSITTGALLLSSVLSLAACVLPGYYTATSIVSTTLGNSVTLLMIYIFIMVYIFQQTKTGEYLVRWLLSRKIVNGRPYMFTAFYFIAVIVIGAVIGSFGIILLAIALLTAITEVSGMKKEDDWIRFLLISTIALSGTTEVFFPFKPYSLLYMSIFDAQLSTVGAACDGTTWLLTAIIMAILSFVALMLIARFAFKFDLSKMKNLDVSVLQTEEFKKISKKQIIVLAAVILSFFYPFFLMLIPEGTGIYTLLSGIGQYLFMGMVIGALCMITVDGEPIAEINDVFKNGTNWQIIFGVGAVIAIGGAMAAEDCGVATWLLNIFMGIFGDMSIVTMVIIVCLFSCFITQFFSNSATAILFLSALAPLAVVLYQNGINVSVLPALIGTGTLTACLLPSGSGQSAIMLGTDIFAGDGQKWVFSKGIIVLIGITVAITVSGVISILIL